MSRLFTGVQKYLQISIFSLKAFRERSLLFAWVAAWLLHTECARQYANLCPSVFAAIRPHSGRILLFAPLSDQSLQLQLPLPFAQLFQALTLQLARPFARDP